MTVGSLLNHNSHLVRPRKQFPVHFLVKPVAASLAELETPLKPDGSPASVATPHTKKTKSPEKSEISNVKSVVEKAVPLPVHYQRLVDDLRILDEALSIFRIKNQVPFFSLLRHNIERVSGRRFSLDHFRQLMTATGGVLFKIEWQEMRDIDGKSGGWDWAIRAIDHEKDGIEIFKRLSSAQSASRKKLVLSSLESKLAEYLKKESSASPDNAYPIKPMDLPNKPVEEAPATPGRARVLSRCDSVASNGSAVKTPKSSTRRQLSVSASPIMPNCLPQFLSTPVKTTQEPKTPMSAKEKLEAIRNRVKAKEIVDAAEAVEYDQEMIAKQKSDEFDLCIKLLVKLNHKFPRGINTAKLSTLKKEYASMFMGGDVEKWTLKLCALVPNHFQMEEIGPETVLRFKTDVKFSVIKKEIENLKAEYEIKTRE